MNSMGLRDAGRIFLVIVASVLIAACGGGGGTNGASGIPETHTIGGSVTGLVGTLVLQNNGGNNLTLTTNGGFTFPGTVPKGSAYSITVLSQPSGPFCAITDPSGTATSNIAVTVVCTADPSTFYIPLSVKPPLTMTGTTGLYGLTSKILDRAPALIRSGNTNFTGYSLNFAVDSSEHVSGGIPFALAFSTVNATGGDHVYAVDLTAGSTLAPRQISSLTFPANLGVQNCGITTAYGDLTDPNSAFFIISVPMDPTNLCGGSVNRYLVGLNNGPAYPPLELPAVITGPVLPLYQPSGALAGFVSVVGSGLNFYRDQTFINPKLLLANVVGFGPIQPAPLSQLTQVSADPTYSFMTLTFPDNSTALYRVDYTGTLSTDLYDFNGDINGLAFDSNNLYLSDAVGFSRPESGTVVQVALDGASKATVLFQYPAGDPFAIVGVSGSQLILEGGPAGGATLLTLPIGVAGAPSQIASFANGIGVAIRSGDLFVTELGLAGSGATLGPTYLSESIALDGTVLQAPTPNSSFVCCSSNGLLQITNTVGPTGLSGGSVSAISVPQPATPTSMPLKDPTGAPFAISNGVVYANSYDLTAALGYVRAQTDANYLAYFYDLSKNLMVAVPVDTSDVFVMGVPN